MTLPDLLGEVNSAPWEISTGGPDAGAPLKARTPATES